jgi:hypothetical protein
MSPALKILLQPAQSLSTRKRSRKKHVAERAAQKQARDGPLRRIDIEGDAESFSGTYEGHGAVIEV